MDQLTAHLDRGWDLAQKGDIRGAETSALRAIELCPESPEAHNLLGFVNSLDGDCEEAVEAYQQAILLDETYVEAMLNAAELLLHPIADFDQAIDLCDRVLDLSEYDDEVVDALLLKFDALWAKGEDAQAKQLLKRLPQGPHQAPMQNFLAGRAFFDVGEIERARPLIAAALDQEPDHPEASYYAGMLAEADGDHQRANVLFLHVRQLELAGGLPPWSPNEQGFMGLVDRAVGELPSELSDLLRHAEVYVVDVPGPEMIVDGIDVHALAAIDPVGMRPGASQPEMSLRVFLYGLNILKSAGSLDGVQATIHEALVQELKNLLDELRATGPSN